MKLPESVIPIISPGKASSIMDFICHKCSRAAEFHLPAQSYVQIVALRSNDLSRPLQRQGVTMVWIRIAWILKTNPENVVSNESTVLSAVTDFWPRGQFQKGMKQLPDPKIIQRTAKENWGKLPSKIGIWSNSGIHLYYLKFPCRVEAALSPIC